MFIITGSLFSWTYKLHDSLLISLAQPMNSQTHFHTLTYTYTHTIGAGRDILFRQTHESESGRWDDLIVFPLD